MENILKKNLFIVHWLSKQEHHLNANDPVRKNSNALPYELPMYICVCVSL